MGNSFVFACILFFVGVMWAGIAIHYDASVFSVTWIGFVGMVLSTLVYALIAVKTKPQGLCKECKRKG